MKQTAVEWLVSILNKEEFAQVVTDEEIAKALAMEKEQIVNAWENGKKSTECKAPICQRKTSNGYFNKTFCRQFIADNKTSSATKCICGKEKFEHI